MKRPLALVGPVAVLAVTLTACKRARTASSDSPDKVSDTIELDEDEKRLAKADTRDSAFCQELALLLVGSQPTMKGRLRSPWGGMSMSAPDTDGSANCTLPDGGHDPEWKRPAAAPLMFE